MRKTTFIQRVREWLEDRKIVDGYIKSLPAGQLKADERREHQLLVECYEREAPHITRIGIELIIFFNEILFRFEVAYYVITGKSTPAWQVEIARMQCEDSDAQLLIYAR